MNTKMYQLEENITDEKYYVEENILVKFINLLFNGKFMFPSLLFKYRSENNNFYENISEILREKNDLRFFFPNLFLKCHCEMLVCRNGVLIIFFEATLTGYKVALFYNSQYNAVRFDF